MQSIIAHSLQNICPQSKTIGFIGGKPQPSQVFIVDLVVLTAVNIGGKKYNGQLSLRAGMHWYWYLILDYLSEEEILNAAIASKRWKEQIVHYIKTVYNREIQELQKLSPSIIKRMNVICLDIEENTSRYIFPLLTKDFTSSSHYRFDGVVKLRLGYLRKLLEEKKRENAEGIPRVSMNKEEASVISSFADCRFLDYPDVGLLVQGISSILCTIEETGSPKKRKSDGSLIQNRLFDISHLDSIFVIKPKINQENILRSQKKTGNMRLDIKNGKFSLESLEFPLNFITKRLDTGIKQYTATIYSGYHSQGCIFVPVIVVWFCKNDGRYKYMLLVYKNK